MTEDLLRVDDLRLYYRTSRGIVKPVDGVSLELGFNQVMALIGESGCGKTSLARAVLRLLPRNVETYTGRIILDGMDVMALREETFRREVRWVKVSFVAQAAMSSLNPVLKVGEQVAEPLITHYHLEKRQALERASEVLRLVGVAVDFHYRYPFELSGGMRQRAVIAMALVTNPFLVILDEPTSALDVLTQASIINALKRIKWERRSSFLLISHDIAISSELADRVAVMYAGQIVELNSATRFYHEPLHPYSHKLMASVPKLHGDKRLEFIPGQPPSLIAPPQGCRFAPRCPLRFSQCQEEPPEVKLGDGQWVRCWSYR